jgi:hypothetical protein
VKHINVASFVADLNGTSSTRANDRAHLATCVSCRDAVDALVRAERVLGGNTEVLSAPERDAILQRVLLAVAPTEALVPRAVPSLPARVLAWCKRGWPVLVPAAVAASVLLFVRGGCRDDDDGFVARSAGRANTPVTVFCVAGETVHTASAAAPCHDDDEVVVRVQFAEPATVHVFGRGLDSSPPGAGEQVAANTDAVLEGSWRRRGATPAQLTVVACRAVCDRATAERRAEAARDAALDGVWHVDVPWTAP